MNSPDYYPSSVVRPIEQFADTLHSAGLILKGPPLFDDRIHRVDVDGKPGGRDGAYKAAIDGDRAFGWYQNWLIHQKPVPWHADGDQRLTHEQLRHLAHEREARNAERAKALQEQHEREAATCRALWGGAEPVDTHAYLVRKGVPSHGLRQGIAGQEITAFRDDGTQYVVPLKGKLFIPMRDERGGLWSLQYISGDGRKRYHPGGRKEGCHFVIGAPAENKPVCIAEGYATGASVHQLSGYPTAAAFDSGNLQPVARMFRSLEPGRLIVLSGDNDHAREAEGKPNVGKLAAITAAEAAGGIAVLPNFLPEQPESSDWNDLMQAVGVEEARVQFRRAMQMAERQNGSNHQCAR